MDSLTPSQPFLSLDLHCRDVILVRASTASELLKFCRNAYLCHYTHGRTSVHSPYSPSEEMASLPPEQISRTAFSAVLSWSTCGCIRIRKPTATYPEMLNLALLQQNLPLIQSRLNHLLWSNELPSHLLVGTRPARSDEPSAVLAERADEELVPRLRDRRRVGRPSLGHGQ